jgi:hypothetical protein
MMHKMLFTAFFIFLASSCRYESDQSHVKTNTSVITIKTGTICGWCAVNDTLIIKGNSVRYVNYWDCMVNHSFGNSNEIKPSELNDLLASLDFSTFTKLELNTCNLCVDGCDDWVFIEYGTDSHYIRFGKDDPEVQPIKSFIDELYMIKTKYSGRSK